MNLRGIKVNPIWVASGAEGFFGEGYWYHRPLKAVMPEKYGFKGAVFTAKTTTLEPRAGNMPLAENKITPKEFFPKCIYVNPQKNFALNAVGLSNPGARFLLEQGIWQHRTDFFFISYMAVEKTVQERLFCFNEFITMLNLFRTFSKVWEFKSAFGLQINISCPNVGLDIEAKEVVEEANEMLYLATRLKMVCVVKTDPLLDPEAICKIARNRYCNAVTPSNTIPFAKLLSILSRYKRDELFPDGMSPLQKRGFTEGGFSGEVCREFSLRTVRSLRRLGCPKPIIAGNGITHPDHVGQFKDAGADGVSIGSVAFLRPWNLQAIIRRGNELFS